MRVQRRLEEGGRLAVDLARDGGAGEGELVGRDADDGAVVLVEGVDGVSALAADGVEG